MLFGHPKGLFVLFLTEMWERFGFYGMRGLLVLYMITTSQDGGLGWSKGDALSMYGTYLAAAWLMPLIGGVLADRWIGPRRAIIFGGIMMSAGFFLLTVHDLTTFYVGLGLLAIGVGFFKPCVTTIVGDLYEKDDPRRDGGFSLFYMGINTGAVLAGVTCGSLAVNYGYSYGFAAAGFGMILGLVVFIFGKKHLGQAGLLAKKTEASELARKQPLSAGEKSRVWVVIGLSLFIVLFTAAYEQAGGLINIYAHEYTNRTVGGWEVPTAWFQSLNPFFIIMFAPVLSALWMKLGKKDPSVGSKLAIGFGLTSLAFVMMVCASVGQGADATVKASMGWLICFNILQTIGELCVYPVIWSNVTKLAPKHLVATLMAVSLAAIGLGSKVAGMIGSYIEQSGPQQIFMGLVISMGLFAVVAFFFGRKLEKVRKTADSLA